MEAAYGLAIILAMLCTTILLANWLIVKRVNSAIVWAFLIFYVFIEVLFLVANTKKFMDGGYVTVGMAGLLFGIMLLWLTAKSIRQRYSDEMKIADYLDQLITLSNDERIPKYATNLVLLSSAKSPQEGGGKGAVLHLADPAEAGRRVLVCPHRNDRRAAHDGV